MITKPENMAVQLDGNLLSGIRQSREQEAVLRFHIQSLTEDYVKEVRKLRALKLVARALDGIEEDPESALAVFKAAAQPPRGKVQKAILQVFRKLKRPLYLRELAFILNKTPASLSSSLKSMVKRGQVTRIQRGLYIH